MTDRPPLRDRIAARTVVGVEHVAGLGPCWEYDGAHDKHGYASIRLSDPRRTAGVHRLVYTLEHPDEDITGSHVDHLCHNHGCIRGEHLRALTPGQNNEHRRGATRASTTGVRGVTRRRGGYMAQARLHGVQHHGGDYATLEEAERAAIALRKRIGMTE